MSEDKMKKMKDEKAGKFDIIDAISDSTFDNRYYIPFAKRHGFQKRKFTNLGEALKLPLAHIFEFAKQNDAIYLLRNKDMAGTDELTAAVIKERGAISIIEYPSILEEHVDLWIKKRRKYHSFYNSK